MAIGRVIKENKASYIIFDNDQTYKAVVRGKIHSSEMGFPKVGDFVEYLKTTEDGVVIENVLPRKTQIARKAVGEKSTERQVIVANVDVIFVVMGLDSDFNLNRLERYVLLAEQSNIRPIIVLNKADVVRDSEKQFESVRERFPNVEVCMVSAKDGTNMIELNNHLGENVTAVLLGSSGAGKSTITNWLLQATLQNTNALHHGGRGRHTTTARELFFLPTGGSLIDTPGLRELGLVGEVVGDTFSSIETLSLQCKFSDCDHVKSTGCAIQEAIHNGQLSEQHFENFLKLKREKDHLDSKGDSGAQLMRKQKNRVLHKKYKRIQRDKYDKR